jgi:hypothetical protein
MFSAKWREKYTAVGYGNTSERRELMGIPSTRAAPREAVPESDHERGLKASRDQRVRDYVSTILAAVGIFLVIVAFAAFTGGNSDGPGISFDSSHAD